MFKRLNNVLKLTFFIFLFVAIGTHNSYKALAFTTDPAEGLYLMDFDNNSVVDEGDLKILASKTVNSPVPNNWYKQFDFNSDNLIDISDLALVSNNFGKTMPDKPVVVLDAGHGGTAPGAIGPTGLKEKDVTIKMALKAGEILKSNGVKVIYTRIEDTFPWGNDENLLNRSKISNEFNADYFVSIHNNSFTNTDTNGQETFYYEGNSTGLSLAQSIQGSLLLSTSLFNRGEKTANFSVIRNTNAVSVLTEVGFISNPTQESLLRDPNYQSMCGQAIANGILNFLRQNY